VHLGGELAAATWDEQNRQRGDNGSCRAGQEGDLEAGVLLPDKERLGGMGSRA
jgi:hypothetical protein